MTQTTEHLGEENRPNHDTKSEDTKETSNADSGCTAQATWGTPQKDTKKESFDLKSNTQVSFDEEKVNDKEPKEEKSGWGVVEPPKSSWGNTNNFDQPEEGFKRRKFDDDRSERRNNFVEPEPAKTLGLFGLLLYATQEDLEEFLKENISDIPYENFNLVKDRITGESRGFAFLHFDSIGKATQAKDLLNGKNMKDKSIRVAYSISKGPRNERSRDDFRRNDRQRDGFDGEKDFQRRDDYRRDDRSFGRRDNFDSGRPRDGERTDGFPRRDDFRREDRPYQRRDGFDGGRGDYQRRDDYRPDDRSFDSRRNDSFDNRRNESFDNRRGGTFERRNDSFDSRRNDSFDGRRDSFDNRRSGSFESRRNDSFDSRRNDNWDRNKREENTNEGSGWGARDNKESSWSSNNWSKKSEREDRFKNNNDRSDTAEERKPKDDNKSSGW